MQLNDKPVRPLPRLHDDNISMVIAEVNTSKSNTVYTWSVDSGGGGGGGGIYVLVDPGYCRDCHCYAKTRPGCALMVLSILHIVACTVAFVVLLVESKFYRYYRIYRCFSVLHDLTAGVSGCASAGCCCCGEFWGVVCVCAVLYGLCVLRSLTWGTYILHKLYSSPESAGSSAVSADLEENYRDYAVYEVCMLITYTILYILAIWTTVVLRRTYRLQKELMENQSSDEDSIDS